MFVTRTPRRRPPATGPLPDRATLACLAAGEAVIVEHVRGDPSVSRIRGQRRAVFPPVALLVLILPAAGVAMVLVQLLRGRRWSDLLRSGSLASGRLVASRPTGLRVQRRPVLRLVYEFADAGRRVRRFTVTTHRPLGTGSREIVLYDPRAPSRAVPWDLLAPFVELGPGGRFVVPGPLAVLWTMAPPAVACGLTAIVLAAS